MAAFVSPYKRWRAWRSWTTLLEVGGKQGMAFDPHLFRGVFYWKVGALYVRVCVYQRHRMLTCALSSGVAVLSLVATLHLDRSKIGCSVDGQLIS